MIERRATAPLNERDAPASKPVMDETIGRESRDLYVDTATGVGVSLPIAGPGARALAFTIDWCIRVVLAAAWYVIAAILYHRRLTLAAPFEPGATWFIFVVMPAAGIYLLYHYVLEIAMRGQTPGKRMVGVRITTRDGGVPSIGAVVTRNVFRIMDGFPLVYGVGLLATMATAHSVRFGDMAAGTVLVYARDDHALFDEVSDELLGTRLDAETAEVVNELLRRWPMLESPARRHLAARVLANQGIAADAMSEAELRTGLERLARGEWP